MKHILYMNLCPGSLRRGGGNIMKGILRIRVGLRPRGFIRLYSVSLISPYSGGRRKSGAVQNNFIMKSYLRWMLIFFW